MRWFCAHTSGSTRSILSSGTGCVLQNHLSRSRTRTRTIWRKNEFLRRHGRRFGRELHASNAIAQPVHKITARIVCWGPFPSPQRYRHRLLAASISRRSNTTRSVSITRVHLPYERGAPSVAVPADVGSRGAVGSPLEPYTTGAVDYMLVMYIHTPYTRSRCVCVCVQFKVKDSEMKREKKCARAVLCRQCLCICVYMPRVCESEIII